MAQRHRLALLALLAASPDRRFNRDKLMVLLWPESDTEKARNLLNVAVYVIRQALGEDSVGTEGDELRLNEQILQVDVVQFDNACAAGRFEEAVSIYRGPLLDGFYLSDSPDFEHWLDGERAGFAASYGKALDSLANEAAQNGANAAAAEWLRLRAVEDPYDSRVALRLIQALDAAGNPAGALKHAQLHERMVESEFGIKPPAEFVAGVEAIRSRPQSVPAPKPTHAATPAAPPEILPEPARKNPHFGKIAGAILATLAVLLLGPRFAKSLLHSGEDSKASIAVLPFVNLSTNPTDAALADGMTDEIISILSRSDRMRVIASTSVFRFRNRELDVRDIADSLHVDNVLEGSFQKVGSRLHLRLRLVDAQDGSTRWSYTYDREMNDIFAVQNDIAQSVASELSVRLAGAAPPPPAGHTNNIAAYEMYLRGSDMTLLRSDSGAAAAIAYFKRAVELDPDYAGAHAGLARLYMRATTGQSARVRHELAEAAARKAVALDDQLSEAHAALGSVYLTRYNFEAAERELKRALTLDPHNVRAFEFLTQAFIWLQQPEQALVASRAALQSDPLSPTAHAEVARALMAAGKYDEALAQLENVRGLRPPLLRAVEVATDSYYAKQDLRKAIETTRSILPGAGPRALARLGFLLARSGQREEALRIRDQLTKTWEKNHDGAFPLAIINAGLNDVDATFLWLQRSADDLSLTIQLMQPMMSAVRADPRFAAFYQQLRNQKT